MHSTIKTQQKIESSLAFQSVFSLNKGLDYLSAANGTPKQMTICLTHQPKMPIISVPHPLQYEGENDNNCVLYSMQMIEALVNLLDEPCKAELVFKWAEAANKKNLDAQDELFDFFSDTFRTYLPCYYNPITREPKSPRELREFHLRQRWNIGSESFSMSYQNENGSATPRC